LIEFRKWEKSAIGFKNRDILSELTECLNGVSSESLVKAVGADRVFYRIFVAGAGRSGRDCARAFGMRLMHLGKTVLCGG
jgi:D-arabinose 5-phosphate isomerase GutQ